MHNHFNKRGRNHQRRRQGVNPNRALDSNGPDVRIRGTAQQIYDKYLALARDATSSGDRVKAENYLQHAEHYFRVTRSIQGPQAPAFDQSQGDQDFDGDQPMIGGEREIRDQRQAPQADEDSPQDAGADQPEDLGVDESGEPAPEQQSQPRAQGGENEGRGRRRRRPRRPRDEQGSDEAADEVEPASA
jgi:hypothetical protein